MTTETIPDPTIEAWSDRLAERLTEAGMEPVQAEAYRTAFELGLTRVISQTATRQELHDGLTALRQEMRDLEAALRAEIRQSSADTRDELRREMSLRFDALEALMLAKFDAQDKRFRILAWAIAIGFGGIFGMLSALIAIVA